MLFVEKIRQFRKEKQLPQRQLVAALGIDTLIYSRIECRNRYAKSEQVIELADYTPYIDKDDSGNVIVVYKLANSVNGQNKIKDENSEQFDGLRVSITPVIKYST